MSYTEADVGTLVVETTSNDGNARWRNSIDILWLDSVGAPLQDAPIVGAFKDFLIGVQRDDCHLTRAFLRPWVRGAGLAGHSVALWDIPLNDPCKNWGSGACFTDSANDGDPTVGEVCILMNKAKLITGGRKHFMSLRNVVWQTLLTQRAGQDPILASSTASTVVTDLNAWAVSKLGAYINTDTKPHFVIVTASVKHSIPPSVDEISGIFFQRLSMRDVRDSSHR